MSVAYLHIATMRGYSEGNLIFIIYSMFVLAFPLYYGSYLCTANLALCHVMF